MKMFNTERKLLGMTELRRAVLVDALHFSDKGSEARGGRGPKVTEAIWTRNPRIRPLRGLASRHQHCPPGLPSGRGSASSPLPTSFPALAPAKALGNDL